MSLKEVGVNISWNRVGWLNGSESACIREMHGSHISARIPAMLSLLAVGRAKRMQGQVASSEFAKNASLAPSFLPLHREVSHLTRR
jgi:hypothetical protein